MLVFAVFSCSRLLLLFRRAAVEEGHLSNEPLCFGGGRVLLVPFSLGCVRAIEMKLRDVVFRVR